MCPDCEILCVETVQHFIHEDPAHKVHRASSNSLLDGYSVADLLAQHPEGDVENSGYIIQFEARDDLESTLEDPPLISQVIFTKRISNWDVRI